MAALTAWSTRAQISEAGLETGVADLAGGPGRLGALHLWVMVVMMKSSKCRVSAYSSYFEVLVVMWQLKIK